MKPLLLAHDHSDLDELLAEFFRMLTLGNVSESFEKLDLFWARLAMHIRAEHLHLFPTLLRALESPGRAKEATSRLRKDCGVPIKESGAAALSQAGRTPSLQTAQDIIARLRDDHDFFMIELAAATKQLRQLRESTHRNSSSLVQRVRERIVQVSERLKMHNELEESDVYPWASLLLTPAECVELNEKMQKELSNIPARFRE
jgi:hemerythrin-like domain-containing protein